MVLLAALLVAGILQTPLFGGGAGEAPRAQCSTRSSSAGGLLTAAHAKAVDRGLPDACQCGLGQDTVAVACEPGGRVSRALRVSATGFGARRSATGVVLVGTHPLDAGTKVRIVGADARGRMQVAVLYGSAAGRLYARFTHVPGPGRATIVATPAGGELTVRLHYGRREIQPAVQQLVMPSGDVPVETAQAYTPPKTLAACGVSPVGAICSRYFDGLWHLEGTGWTGGDGALSVRLPDGRDAWLFGDTFLGTIGPGGARPLGSPWARNSIVLQQAEHMVTLTRDEDSAIIPEPDTTRWYWPGAGVVEGGALRVFAHEFEQSGPGPWDLRYLHTAVATFSLPDMAYQGLVILPTSPHVVWGNWVLEEGAWTYVYGSAIQPTDLPFVARARRGHVRDPWQYFDGSGWSPSPASAAPIGSLVPNQFGVVKVAGGYSLISMGRAFSPAIYTRFARSPSGPFEAPKLIYTAPVTSATYVYGAVPHPEFTQAGRVLVSYSASALDLLDLFRHPEYYRPRFIRVPLAALTE